MSVVMVTAAVGNLYISATATEHLLTILKFQLILHMPLASIVGDWSDTDLRVCHSASIMTKL